MIHVPCRMQDGAGLWRILSSYSERAPLTGYRLFISGIFLFDIFWPLLAGGDWNHLGSRIYIYISQTLFPSLKIYIYIILITFAHCGSTDNWGVSILNNCQHFWWEAFIANMFTPFIKVCTTMSLIYYWPVFPVVARNLSARAISCNCTCTKKLVTFGGMGENEVNRTFWRLYVFLVI